MYRRIDDMFHVRSCMRLGRQLGSDDVAARASGAAPIGGLALRAVSTQGRAGRLEVARGGFADRTWFVVISCRIQSPRVASSLVVASGS